jgi:mitosis inhibitor protein kinase SWE1
MRLREEVEILQHLSEAARTMSTIGSRNGHPNVLSFVDSWEEDERLFIRTELCELGNFARFLWEYGRAFPRLDEARVWKIIADLSNVSNGARSDWERSDTKNIWCRDYYLYTKLG